MKAPNLRVILFCAGGESGDRVALLCGMASVFLYGIDKEWPSRTPGGRVRKVPRGSSGASRRRQDPPQVAVHGNRIAFCQNVGQEASLYLAQPGEDAGTPPSHPPRVVECSRSAVR